MKIEPQAFCEAFWRGKTRRFALALSEGFIHFWEPDSDEFRAAPDEWKWVVADAIPERRGLNDAKFPVQINADFLITVFKHLLEDRRVGRYIKHLGKPILLGFYGSGTILLRGSDHPPFLFEGAKELWTQSESFWHNQIDRWLGEEGDFVFAWKWTGFSDNERAEYLTELCQGDWGELSRVARWILALDGQEQTPQPFPAETLIACLRCFNRDYSVFVQNEDDELGSRRLDLWNEWLRFFNPVFRYDIAEKHIAADSFSRHAFERTEFGPIKILSQHERLELLLQLRDWLRERAGLPDERINELLG